MVRSIVSRFGALPLVCALALAGTLILPAVSQADPYDHHGRGGEWHDRGRHGDGWRGGGREGWGWRGPGLIIGPRLLPPPVYYAPPPVYYAPPPPPLYYAPQAPAYYAPPPVVYARPPVYAAPSLSLGINIPLR